MKYTQTKRKTIILAVLVTLFLISHFPASPTGGSFLTSVDAATPTVTQTPAQNAKLDQQIDKLKDKIASRVSQLNLVEKRGIIGTIQDTKSNQITLTDTNGVTRYVDVDEITKFSSPRDKTFGISDLIKGTQVSVLGIYNKESKRILARFVDSFTLARRETGVIASIDSKNYQLTLSTEKNKQITVDINSTTSIKSFSEGNVTRSGFSKVAIGDRIYIIGYPDKKDPTLLEADRIIIYPGVAKDPNINMTVPTPTVTLAPTSTGAKSIKPLQ